MDEFRCEANKRFENGDTVSTRQISKYCYVADKIYLNGSTVSLYEYYKYLGDIKKVANDSDMLDKYIKNAAMIANELIEEIRILYSVYQSEFGKLSYKNGASCVKFDITTYRTLIEGYLELDMADYGMRGVKSYCIETNDCKNPLRYGRVTIELTPVICSDILTDMPSLWNKISDIIGELEVSYSNKSMNIYDLSEIVSQYTMKFSNALKYLREVNNMGARQL